MEISIQVGEQVTIGWAGETKLAGFDFRLRLIGAYLQSQALVPAPWHKWQGADKFGEFQAWSRYFSWEDQELLEERLFLYNEALRHEVHFPRGLSRLRGSKDFLSPAVITSLFFFFPEKRYFLCTFGLDGAGGEYPGGYWPQSHWGPGSTGFPQKPFAPVVLYDERGAVAIAPGELFLLSPLIFSEGRIGRALAGDFPEVPAGTVLSTWFVFGRDPGEALRRLGTLLLSVAGKQRAEPQSTPLLSRLGYWNAYGSYYTELIHPMEEKILRSLAAEFRAKGIPVGYFGLDLWYSYERIGQALEFRPDSEKYPRGLRPLQEETGIPFVFHLSALSPGNAYRAEGADPRVYEEMAAELKRQGAIGVWHDWLRTWQFLTPALLGDPWAAERWFSGMCRAFGEAGLPVLLCMQTMGMVLAATQEPNVISARSYTDHLFSLGPALRRAAKTDPHIGRSWQKPVHIWIQNLLVGYVQWALGLAPFHDLFLSRRHPGFGGEGAWEEAVLRVLSCGPVGFGDACGLADPRLLSRLVLSEGRLAQPARPPEPVWATLTSSTPIFWSETRAGELRWLYALALNLDEEEKEVRIEPPTEGDFLSWDPRAGRGDAFSVRVPAGSLVYRVFVPKVGKAGILGLPELLVPMPTTTNVKIFCEHRRWKISRPAGLELHAILPNGKITPAEGLILK